MLEETLTNSILRGAIEVFKHWVPGLHEEINERSLCRELRHHKHNYEQPLKIPLIYKDEKVGEDLNLDIWVERKVIVKNKHIKERLPVHATQLLTYLTLTGCRVGLLIHFNVPVLKNGIKRIVL